MQNERDLDVNMQLTDDCKVKATQLYRHDQVHDRSLLYKNKRLKTRTVNIITPPGSKEFPVILIVMAFKQHFQTHQGSSQMLPRVVSTEQQSLVVVKKLLAIAVSSITYLRGLFPEKAYGSKYVEEQKVMILREERTCPGASQIVQCKSQKNVTKMDCNDIKKASILLVRKLYTLMQNLGPLPDSVCLNMKLSYYDNVTPHDYQPPGFKEGENSMLVFQKEPVNLTMGEVVTPFHTLKMDVTTEKERLEQVDDDEPICARDRWTLKINEDEMVCVSKVQQEGVSKENVVIDTGIENSGNLSQKVQVHYQFIF
ncbi:HORMA domain-containing protein 1 [Bagarius yarrelli]|uniref:HORMA domain-containing protein 1 n=1 Tax=Bagarius yarrelli TaxID=175774 RepID=A0A556TQ33_BAGYA|nr:HORMA domain-containing protein 1 [Bagarius yarrelli]